MSIPILEFNPQKPVKTGVEIIDLKSIYERMPDFDHDLAKPHRQKFHCLFYIEKGKGNHFIDFNTYPYIEGSFIVINKGQAHAFDLASRSKGKALIFTEEFITTTHTNIRMPFFAANYLLESYAPILTCDAALKVSCESLLHEIELEQVRSSPSNILIHLLFASLLLMILRDRRSSYSNQLSEKQIKQFTCFLNLLEEQFWETRDASAYAEMMHISYKTLNQLCKSAVNKTAKQLIDAYTILEAKRSLVIEDIAIRSLAYKLGFNEDSNFVKYFKKHTLQTPTQFKKSF